MGSLLQALGLAPLPASAGGAVNAAAAPKAGAEAPLDVKADAAAALQHVLDLVLGGITDDVARKAVDADYQKLKATFDKADALAGAKAKVAAYQAILPQAQAMHAKAEGIRYAFELWAGNGQALVEPARAAIGKNGGPAKAALSATLDGLVADGLKAARSGDSTALQATVQPQVVKLHEIVTQLPKRSVEIDAGIAAAAKILLKLDKTKATALLVRLAALQDKKKSGWPAGSGFDEIVASVDGLIAEAQALQTEGQAMANGLQDEHELEVVQKRLDGLKPRIDRANDTGMPAAIQKMQANVLLQSKTIDEQMAAKNKPAVLRTLGILTLALGQMEETKDRWSAYRSKFEAALNGPVKAARALALKPADFATSRDNQLQQKQAEIEKSTLDGVFDPALTQIDVWIQQANAWAKAQQAYENLHGKSPDAGKLADLADLPGGDKVLDRLVEDLPPSTTPKVLVTALKARYGVDVTQFERLQHDKADPNKMTMSIDKDTKIDPTKPDPDQEIDLEGLYKVLGTMPKKDVGYVEKIERVTKDELAASYQSGVFTDTIALHCGRPSDTNKTQLNAPGQVVPEGEHVAPGCEPPPGDGPKYFDFTVLHEVGHAVDDARNIMSGERGKDAGWETPGTGRIAERIAGQVAYDKNYIESMLDDKGSKPPSHRPEPPKGRDAADWDKARVEAESWVKDIRVDNKLWDKAGVAKRRSVDGIVYQEAYAGSWVSYKYAARSQGITGYQFRSPAEWFAELYAAFHSGKLNPKHPATAWLRKLNAESQSS